MECSVSADSFAAWPRTPLGARPCPPPAVLADIAPPETRLPVRDSREDVPAVLLFEELLHALRRPLQQLQCRPRLLLNSAFVLLVILLTLPLTHALTSSMGFTSGEYFG